jgi:hypothetical protein
VIESMLARVRVRWYMSRFTEPSGEDERLLAVYRSFTMAMLAQGHDDSMNEVPFIEFKAWVIEAGYPVYYDELYAMSFIACRSLVAA